MYIHLEIFFCIFTLMLGSWVVYNIFHLSRTTKHSFLSPIAFFILFYNLSIFVRLVSQYTCANILASCFIFNASIYSKALAPIAMLINIGMTTSIGASVFAFLGRRLSIKTKVLIGGVTLLILIGYVYRVLLSPQLNLLPWLPLFNQHIYLVIILVAYIFLLYLLIVIRKEPDHLKIRTASSFAIFYLAAYTALVLSFLFFPILQYFFVAVVHLLFNTFLIFWIRYYFLPYHRSTLSVLTNKGVLNNFFEKHGISKREQEIAELVLEGKSTKEIEKYLFISPHTVKNHLYSIYQKSGVKSRSQLIHSMLSLGECSLEDGVIYKERNNQNTGA